MLRQFDLFVDDLINELAISELAVYPWRVRMLCDPNKIKQVYFEISSAWLFISWDKKSPINGVAALELMTTRVDLHNSEVFLFQKDGVVVYIECHKNEHEAQKLFADMIYEQALIVLCNELYPQLLPFDGETLDDDIPWY